MTGRGDDVFTLDCLIDAAANSGIALRMSATRPYGRGPVTGTA